MKKFVKNFKICTTKKFLCIACIFLKVELNFAVEISFYADFFEGHIQHKARPKCTFNHLFPHSSTLII